jgi:hypothetical protein
MTFPLKGNAVHTERTSGIGAPDCVYASRGKAVTASALARESKGVVATVPSSRRVTNDDARALGEEAAINSRPARRAARLTPLRAAGWRA